MTEINIQREDAANYVDIVDIHPDHDEYAPEYASSRVAQLFNKNNLVPAIYIGLGVFLISTIFMLFNAYVVHLKVETSIVSSHIEAMRAPSTGYLSEVAVTPGAKVKKGMVLARIEDLDLLKDIQLAKIQANDAKLDLEYYQNLSTNEQHRLSIYKEINTNRLASTRALVDTAQQATLAAKHHLDRMRALHEKQYVTDANLEEALSKYKHAQSELADAQAQMHIGDHALQHMDKGMFFTGVKLEGVGLDLNAQIAMAEKRLKLNEEKVAVYANLLDHLVLRAPFDGKVTHVLSVTGNTAERGNPILLIEQTNANKQIIAYLTQDEITHVSVSGKARIYVPALRKTYRGKVVEVDRTEGFIDEIKAQYRWRDLQTDRSAMVTVSLDPRDAKKFNREVYAGMPAIVYFARKSTLL